jgi:hypothetical protein
MQLALGVKVVILHLGLDCVNTCNPCSSNELGLEYLDLALLVLKLLKCEIQRF